MFPVGVGVHILGLGFRLGLLQAVCVGGLESLGETFGQNLFQGIWVF